MNAMIYDPLEEFDSKFKNLHLENTKKYLEDLVQRSRVDAVQNRKTVKEYTDLKEHLARLRRRCGWWRVLRVLLFITIILIPVAIWVLNPKIRAMRAAIEQADKIVLPGVGAFGDAAEKLFSSGLADVLIEQAKRGKPILGICLGMQLLFEKSYEYGEHNGLGLIKGEIRPIAEVIPRELKIPHIGWNALQFGKKKNELFRYVAEGEHVYFVHSYYGANCAESVIATTDYGAPLTAAVAKGNVYGCQFHPEKSGNTGLNILRAFCEGEK
jgi:glutamine amidotransferase